MELGNIYASDDDFIGMDGNMARSDNTQDAFCYAFRTDNNEASYTETLKDSQGNLMASGSFTSKETGTYETTTTGRITYKDGSYEDWTVVYSISKETITVKYSDGYKLSLTYDSSGNVSGSITDASGTTLAAISGKPSAQNYEGTELTVTYKDGTKETLTI